MDNVVKTIFGSIGGSIAFFAPVHSLCVLIFVFVGVDFITGVWASHKRAIRRRQKWVFSSEKMRNTAYKLVFYLFGVIGTWLMQDRVFTFVELHLDKVFTGFILGVEFFSFLENAADISDHPVFRWLRKFTAKELKDKAGIDIEDHEKTS
jgi:hypothetical protein